MGKKVKEDERIEKIIRGLLKLPENRRCINCNSLGPQYVCTTFWTFVCTNCSGVHREFTHRVKSVSMAKFTAEEAEALQAGGNDRARQIYFKEWDSQRHLFPDSNNLHKLRDFIRDIYVERRYAGERRDDRSPRLGLLQRDKGEITAYRSASQSPQHGNRLERGRSLSALWKSDEKSFTNFFEERELESLKIEGNRPGGASAWKSEEQTFKTYLNERIRRSSPRFAGKNEERTLKHFFEERRSPRNNMESSRYKKSPVRFEIVDDRIRDEDGRRYNLTRRSVELEKSRKSFDESALNQKIVSSSSQVSAEKDKAASSGTQDLGKRDQVEQKKEIGESESLIDFQTDPKPPDAEAAAEKQLVPSSSEDDRKAVSHSEKERGPQAPDPNSLEALLFGFSTPASGPSQNTTEAQYNSSIQSDAPPKQILALPDCAGASSTVLSNSMPIQFSNEQPFSVHPDSGRDSCPKLDDSHELSTNQQHQFSAFPAEDQSMSTAALNDQQHSWLEENIATAPSDSSAEKAIVAVPQLSEDANSVPAETISSQRKELPADLFTVSYSPNPQQFLGWQSGPQQTYGYGIQYYPRAMLMPAFTNSTKSTNPFDFNAEPPPVRAPQFPTMTSLQGALQDTSAPRGIAGPFSFDPHPEGLMVPHSASSASGMPQNLAPFPSITSPSPYMEQQTQSRMPSLSSPGFNGLGSSDGAALASLNINEEPDNIYLAPSSKGRNPFG